MSQDEFNVFRFNPIEPAYSEYVDENKPPIADHVNISFPSPQTTKMMLWVTGKCIQDKYTVFKVVTGRIQDAPLGEGIVAQNTLQVEINLTTQLQYGEYFIEAYSDNNQTIRVIEFGSTGTVA